MSDKKGMILIDSLFFFMIVSMLVGLLSSCVYANHQMHLLNEKSMQNEELKAIWKKE